MEDITVEFKERCDNFYRTYEEHLERRQHYTDLIEQFNSDLDNLSKIPILPGLMRNAEEQPFHAFDEYLAESSESFTTSDAAVTNTTLKSTPRKNSTVIKSNSCEETQADVNIASGCEGHSTQSVLLERKLRLSLLQWMTSSEFERSIRHLAVNTNRGLSFFKDQKMESLKTEAQKVIDHAKNDNMKEIRGIEDRLSNLDKLIFDANVKVKEQFELAQAIQQNQIRASSLADASILPDLCASHCRQLTVMSHNHRDIRDFRRRITKAKEELAANLNQRLKYVVYVENKMYEIDNNLLFYHRCMHRLQRHLSIIEQIHKAPSMYVSAVTEVVRRRVFSNAFLMVSTLVFNLLAFLK